MARYDHHQGWEPAAQPPGTPDLYLCDWTPQDGYFCRMKRVCEKSDGCRSLQKPTSAFDIWRIFIRGERSNDHFFEVPKRFPGFFTQALNAAFRTVPRFQAGAVSVCTRG
jgi:hypothetical protein